MLALNDLPQKLSRKILLSKLIDHQALLLVTILHRGAIFARERGYLSHVVYCLRIKRGEIHGHFDRVVKESNITCV